MAESSIGVAFSPPTTKKPKFPSRSDSDEPVVDDRKVRKEKRNPIPPPTPEPKLDDDRQVLLFEFDNLLPILIPFFSYPY